MTDTPTPPGAALLAQVRAVAAAMDYFALPLVFHERDATKGHHATVYDAEGNWLFNVVDRLSEEPVRRMVYLLNARNLDWAALRELAEEHAALKALMPNGDCCKGLAPMCAAGCAVERAGIAVVKSRDAALTQVATLEADLARANAAYRNVREIEDRLRLEAVERERRITTLEAELHDMHQRVQAVETERNRLRESLEGVMTHEDENTRLRARLTALEAERDEALVIGHNVVTERDALAAEVARLRAVVKAACVLRAEEHRDDDDPVLVQARANFDALTPERAEDGRDGDAMEGKE